MVILKRFIFDISFAVPSEERAMTCISGWKHTVKHIYTTGHRSYNITGATNTHYVNSNGLPDDEHYTTVYDMYLILSAASGMEAFTDIIKTVSYDASYESASGNTVTQKWVNTNRYLDGRATAPENISVIGGKTGTTGQAGYCLILLSRNEKNEMLYSFVFGAGSGGDLYYYMNQILSEFG